MQIDRIKITNFKSIPELDLNFHEMNGLWEISGVVGAGKTTIGEAILFALFGTVRGKTNDSLISWGKKHTLVEAWVYTKNRHLHIRREINSYGQSPLLADVDGEEVLGSDKRSIQGILESEWYDVSRQTLELLCVISFNNFKSLSTLNTADSREFLNSTIAFDKIEMYEDYCREQIKAENDDISKHEKEKQRYIGSINALDDTLPQKPKYENLDEVTALVNAKKSEWDWMHDVMVRHRKELDADWKIKGEQSKVAATALKVVKDNIKKLKSGICPVCGQPVTPEHKAEMQAECDERQRLADHAKEVSEFYARKCIDYDKEMGEVNEQYDNEWSILRWEQSKTEQYASQMKTIETKRADYNKHIKEEEKAIEECTKMANDWREMLDFLRDTVRPTIISSLIPNINKYIQLYMGRTHQNYIVFFDENFKCMMKNPFNETIPVSSLSTGQKKVIDMIIILAFIKTFITQIDFNVYFMDELVGNIDADLRDEMCGLLRDTLDRKDVMFLISHSPINQEYLDGIIKVSRIAGVSEYTVMNITK